MPKLVKKHLPDDRLWTIAEVARYLRMSVRWVQTSDVPRAKLRGRGRGEREAVRFEPGSVKAWVLVQQRR